MGNPVVHFELSGPDPETAAKFYSDLFGWHTQSMREMNYVVIDTHAGKGINGGLGKIDDAPASTTFYVEVSDLQATLVKAESLGGRTLTEVTEIPNIVTFAVLADPEGNPVGIVKGVEPGQEAPGVSEGSNPGIEWFEILGKDARALQSFYSELFGWTVKASQVDGIEYGEVDTGSERGIPGGIGAGPEGQRAVTAYAHVAELEPVLERAEELGAKTVLEPLPVGEATVVAAFKDPQDRVFGIYKTTA